ncbi:MAG TPA: ABC transporter permease, partial [Gemmatimonadaceae bacterium]|nr:ABC transporter permease [Gemmatimonadaceae bacterium]
IGKAINVEGFPMTVVGVMPEGANLPDLTVELWAPAHVDSTTNWNNHSWSAIGRLKPGVTAADAQRDLAPLTARLPEVFPSVYRPTFVTSTGFTTNVVSLRDAVVGDIVTRALWTLFGAVGLVLLIGAANVANLFLVRLDSRRREVALRTALGAGTRHLAWHYFAESLLIAVISAIGAIALAQAMLSLLLAIAPSELPRLAEVGLSGTSIAFAFGCALLAGLVFGLLPLTGARLDNTILREGGRGLTTSRRGLMARRVLVAAQMAFAVVLLVSAMLMVQTFRNLRAVDAGFDPRGVMTAQISLPALRYNGEPDLASNFYEQLAGRLRELPGVELVGFTDHLPMLSGDLCNGVTLEGPTPESATGTCPPAWLVSPDYFEAMGIRVEGRTLDWSGMNAHDGGMVVSRAFAEHHWPNESAIGKGIKFNSSKPPFYRVVGVAEDVRGLGVNEPPIEVIYFPMRPIPDAPLWGAPTGMNVMIRSSLSRPIELAGAVRRIVRELDPQVAVANERSMEAIVAASMAKHSFTMVLLVIAGGIAIVLSAVGIYGVISYIVTERRGEIGVRMALGARVEQVTRLVLRQSLGLAIIGVVIGVLAAVATTRLMRALLFGVGASDPLTMVAVPLLLLGVTVIASYAPARRAAHIDPAEVMRSE